MGMLTMIIWQRHSPLAKSKEIVLHLIKKKRNIRKNQKVVVSNKVALQ